MIIWIASYPGSGDELLIHAMFERYGFSWYEADILDQSNLDLARSSSANGQKSARGKWRKVYEKALESDRIILARTRMPPTDDQPFLYVSRNGCDAIRTFFNRNFQSSADVSVTSLIMGHYLYGDWTSNYEKWWNHRHNAPCAFLKIEDFANDPDGFWKSISTVVTAPQKQEITFDVAQVIQNRYSPGVELSPAQAMLYQCLHGKSAAQRGYPSTPQAPNSESPPQIPLQIPLDAIVQFVETHRQSVALAAQIREMQGYIDSLNEQLAEETNRLRDYVEILKQENDHLKGSVP